MLMFMRHMSLYFSCFYFLPSLVSNKIYRKGSDTWCPIEAVGKDPDEEEEDEEEEEEDEEEEEEEEEKKVELLHSPVTLLPDLMEFERWEEQGSCGGRHSAGACCPSVHPRTRPQLWKL